jgi:hypothetical protein
MLCVVLTVVFPRFLEHVVDAPGLESFLYWVSAPSKASIEEEHLQIDIARTA